MLTALFVLGGLVAAVLLSGIAAAEPPRSSTPAPVRCDRVASLGGSDRAPGTRRQPFRTVRKLADSLRAGQTGCLRRGTYREQVNIRRGGRPGAALTIRARPGETARIRGRIVIERRASFVTFSNLLLDGSTAPRCVRGSTCAVKPSPTVYASHTTFRAVDATNGRRGICFVLGRFGAPVLAPVVESSRIHDCGRRPRRNFDHGVYVESARDGRISGNTIIDNADRGIQLYPDAQRTVIIGNVIDGNGQGIIFSGAGRVASSGNRVEGNVISRSREGFNVGSFYPPGTPAGRDNVVRGNCLFGGAPGENGGISPPHVGFGVEDNRVADPAYVNPSARDLRLSDESPCRDLLGPGGR